MPEILAAISAFQEGAPALAVGNFLGSNMVNVLMLALLDLVVRRLAEHGDVALARIWLVREGDICTSCRMREECPTNVPCLHLVVSAGRSRAEPGADWTRIDGDFRRFPVGQRKVGSVAASSGISVAASRSAAFGRSSCRFSTTSSRTGPCSPSAPERSSIGSSTETVSYWR